MVTIAIVAVVAASLFTAGTVIKPKEPLVGTILQGAGVGTMIGGGLGTLGGAASALGAATAGGAVTAGAVVGGSVGGAVAPVLFPPRPPKPIK